MNVYFITGYPCTNKNKYAEELARELGYTHISFVDDIYRHKRSRHTPSAKKVDEGLNKWLIDDDFINNLWFNKMARISLISKGVIVSGYPRTEKQAKYMLAYMNVLRKTPVSLFIVSRPKEGLIHEISLYKKYKYKRNKIPFCRLFGIYNEYKEAFEKIESYLQVVLKTYSVEMGDKCVGEIKNLIQQS